MHMKIDEQFEHDPNAEIIRNFMHLEFPEIDHPGNETVLEGVMSEMIGSRQVRLAGRPDPESEVIMRDLVRTCISQGHPIPVLVVSGPKKTPIGEGVDIAEVSALKMLACLNRRVQKYFPPGISVRIRLEDITGYYLEEGTDGLHETIENYSQGFMKLVDVLGYDFIDAFRETEIMREDLFREKALEMHSLMMEYLTSSEDIPEKLWGELESAKRLEEVGWKGGIPSEMRKFYHKRYYLLYPQ